ncbi:hypothetical protein ACFOTA_20835 [Chitinophaga sp. GCM10012297]|uniref:Uncharacterized protein n=1 Tax=Chitinophaga chungangae TaxID=2821488 RepID=A0ABS3YK39_9BACT|nr:hypothetical protein [Chitinophaga chungangae]MBO9154673.1 hypothetical protein [Chitinophaga chungangae]
MKSIAIWSTPLPNTTKSVENLELHFNLWKIPNGESGPSKFIDIGIKVESERNIDSLNLYFPKRIEKDDFEDIVSKFIDKPDLVSAIFNEDYDVVSNASTKFYEIRKAKETVFYIYRTSDTDLQFTNCYGGTIVSFKIPPRREKIYFRFRIKGEFVNSLSSVSRPTNAIFQSAFSIIEMIDFRVNEIRDLNLDLLEKIRSDGEVRISKLHFFFICSNKEEVVGNHLPYGNCRNLENYRWDNYVDLRENRGNVYLAYHWKETNKENVAVLIKTRYEKNNWSTIFKYLLIGAAIALLIELVSNYVYDIIKENLR